MKTSRSNSITKEGIDENLDSRRTVEMQGNKEKTKKITNKNLLVTEVRKVNKEKVKY